MIDIAPVAALLIPLKVQTAVVVPFIPILIELPVEVLPIVFPEIVKFPPALATLAVLIP